MSNPNSINDGGLGFACRKLDIYIPDASTGGSGVATTYTAKRGTYLAESISPDRPMAVANRKDQLGIPNGAIGQKDFNTLSAVIQLPGDPSVVAVSPAPQVQQIQEGDAFNIVLDVTRGPETWWCTKISAPEEQNGIKKQNGTFQKAVSMTCQATA